MSIVVPVLSPMIAVVVACGVSFPSRVMAQWSAPSAGQTYPAKPVRLLFGYTAGGAGDVSARMLAQKLAESLGQNVLVENRPGAGGAIADEIVARAPADGYTLLYAAGSMAILPSLRAKLPYDVERDFAPVSLVAITSFVLALHPSVPVHDVKTFIALARSQPGKLTFSSPGIGSSSHFAAEVFKMMTYVKMLHVPFKGPPEAIAAVVSGELDAGFPSVTGALPLIATHRLKALAVSSSKRASQLPAVPTLDEAGVAGYERAGWNGVLAPAAVPKEIITRLNTIIVRSANTAEMKDAFFKQGLETQTSTPEQFSAFIRFELAQNAKVARFSGIRAE